MLVITSYIQIADWELLFSYARSSGAGGQNVNKVNSKAILHWNPMASPSLPVDVKNRFMQKFGKRLSGDGFLVLQSDSHRDQPRNSADCLEKLRAMILEVAVAPKVRKATKPSRSAKRKRLESKKRHSEKKSNRRPVD